MRPIQTDGHEEKTSENEGLDRHTNRSACKYEKRWIQQASINTYIDKQLITVYTDHNH